MVATPSPLPHGLPLLLMKMSRSNQPSHSKGGRREEEERHPGGGVGGASSLQRRCELWRLEEYR